MLPLIAALAATGIAYTFFKNKSRKHVLSTKDSVEKKVGVYFIHGFQSSHKEAWGFIIGSLLKMNNIMKHFEIYQTDWDAGKPIGILEHASGILNTYMVDGYTYPDRIHEEWDRALSNIPKVSLHVAERINRETSVNDPVVLVGHSMGGEVIAQIVPLLRDDIKISSVVMGGVPNISDYEGLVSNYNVMRLLNLYIGDDAILDAILENMSGCYFEPMGLHPIEHHKVINIECKGLHSSYLGNRSTVEHIEKLLMKIVG